MPKKKNEKKYVAKKKNNKGNGYGKYKKA